MNKGNHNIGLIWVILLAKAEGLSVQKCKQISNLKKYQTFQQHGLVNQVIYQLHGKYHNNVWKRKKICPWLDSLGTFFISE